MSNVERVDLAQFTVFVSTFLPGASLFNHAHEDLLSYVVYFGIREVLIDPGLPDYTTTYASHKAQAMHNGLGNSHRPLRPLRRFFVSRAMQAGLTVKMRKEAHQAEFAAEARPLGSRKHLQFSLSPGGSLLIEERLEASEAYKAACLTLNVADPKARIEANAIVAPGYEIRVSAPEAPVVAPIVRGRDYGVTGPATQAVWRFAPAREISSRCEILCNA